MKLKKTSWNKNIIKKENSKPKAMLNPWKDNLAVLWYGEADLIGKKYDFPRANKYQ